jgi:hypothetical protein
MGDTQRQINQLRGQVEMLMRERVTPAVTDVQVVPTEPCQPLASRLRYFLAKSRNGLCSPS